jgi:hypothetical protein
MTYYFVIELRVNITVSKEANRLLSMFPRLFECLQRMQNGFDCACSFDILITLITNYFVRALVARNSTQAATIAVATTVNSVCVFQPD